MDFDTLFEVYGLAWFSFAFAALVGLAALLVWAAFAPARPSGQVRARLDDYLDRGNLLEGDAMSQPVTSRILLPLLRRLLRLVGALAPKRGVERTRQMLIRAGEPAGLTALDFTGVRLFSALFLAGVYHLLVGWNLSPGMALRNVAVFAALGYLLPGIWLRSRVRRRQREIGRALPDALDMLTIGVEAGLAFETAMVRVGEKWDNALSREFRRAVGEMRVGTPRPDALQRMAERSGVSELDTFVAILVQSFQLGVSIAQVLHSQAAEMRIRRRQRAEELARQASTKIAFPLVLFIMPALFAIALGPAVPRIVALLSQFRLPGTP